MRPILATAALLLGLAPALVAAMEARPARSRYSVTIPIGPPAKLPPPPEVSGPAGRPLVVIDPGHGGHDPGAVSPHGGAREKEVTLAVARAIRDELLRSGRARVALTRDDDRFIVLKERYGIAQRLKADLFISIHADSAPEPEASGATVYTLSDTASDGAAARFAQRENRADVLNGVDLGGGSDAVDAILLDLARRESMEVSARFARLLERESRPFVPLRPDFRRFAALAVLRAPDTPSVLFETGYLSNRADVAFLNSADGRQRLARGVARAVETHFARLVASRAGGR